MDEKKETIVVGVDGSAGSSLALRWALKEAECRGGTVKAVASWQWQGSGEPALEENGPDVAREFAISGLEDTVREVLADWAEPRPEVAREVAQGRPSDVLIAAAEGADLLVLGSHGHSRLRHVAVGSVSEACLQRATCPVVVIPIPHEMRRHMRKAEKVTQ